jgi:hypothetical protein
MFTKVLTAMLLIALVVMMVLCGFYGWMHDELQIKRVLK